MIFTRSPTAQSWKSCQLWAHAGAQFAGLRTVRMAVSREWWGMVLHAVGVQSVVVSPEPSPV